ncbi:E3 ubiquitin-protein ligase TRIM35-like isoform X2 [Chanodichthys erythropterus]|uniref:E3 ubiquitin-protein ligase TRIM35-like isoform X2 n=1 Tax=Chanodichthys erythropterus TaxID=933992 RepID=UPI00351ECA27
MYFVICSEIHSKSNLPNPAVDPYSSTVLQHLVCHIFAMSEIQLFSSKDESLISQESSPHSPHIRSAPAPPDVISESLEPLHGHQPIHTPRRRGLPSPSPTRYQPASPASLYALTHPTIPAIEKWTVEELNTALKSLQKKLQHNEKMKGKFEKTVQHIKSQAEHTERQIKQQFEKLHQFLRDEEEATITALREEEEQKKQMMKEKLEEMNRHISALSHTIKDMEEMMKANDVCFLKEFPVSKERVQSSQPDPQMDSEALIHVPNHLGNLLFRVWKKMQDIVQNTPVILDPNTADPHLVLSDDLTSVRNSGNTQPLPDNPERFDCHYCVLGSEGFNSGTHCWDVEVKESQYWRLGVTTASNQRKGWDFFNTDVWSVSYDPYGLCLFSVFRVNQDLDRVRVNLDYDRGTVSFSDPVTNTHLHTFTHTFTHTLFPFFWCNRSSSLRILSVNSQ